jgi:hypothetical protein
MDKRSVTANDEDARRAIDTTGRNSFGLMI